MNRFQIMIGVSGGMPFMLHEQTETDLLHLWHDALTTNKALLTWESGSLKVYYILGVVKLK